MRAVALLLLVTAGLSGAAESPLRLRGTLASLQLESNERHGARFRATLAIEIINVSDRPQIVLRREPMLFEHTFSQGGEFESNETSFGPPRSQLDYPAPPAALTVTLQPGESYSTRATIPLEVDDKSPSRITLELNSKSWTFSIRDDTAPEDDRLDSEEIRAVLARRWEGVGELYVGEVDCDPIEMVLPARPAPPPATGLVLRGEVTAVRPGEDTEREKAFELDLLVEFKNTGSRPVLMLAPQALEKFVGWPHHWLAGQRVALSPEALSRGDFLLAQDLWPSVYRDDRWEALQAALDVPEPPSSLVWVIPPGSSNHFATSTHLHFPKKDFSMDALRRDVQWSEVPKGVSLWLRFDLEIWPFNVEPGASSRNLAFGRKLRERWIAFGRLELGDGGTIVSEPMKFTLSDK